MFFRNSKRKARLAVPPGEAAIDRGVFDSALSEGDYFAEEISRLHASDPGWDEPMRVRGALRRLARSGFSRDSIVAVEEIYGRETLVTALKQLQKVIGHMVDDFESDSARHGLESEIDRFQQEEFKVHA